MKTIFSRAQQLLFAGDIMERSDEKKTPFVSLIKAITLMVIDLFEDDYLSKNIESLKI